MRKLGLISTLCAGLLFFPLAGFALGLGEIEASSYLNQPLKAEIDVISARPGEIDDLLISLASRDAFAKAGLERPAGLSKLRFKVEKSEDGSTAKILVTTKTPIVEPFLSFLVEADWAKGRLLREFTVLLDPISFAQQAVTPAPQVAPEQAPVQQPESTPSQTTMPEVTPQDIDQDLPAVPQPIATSTDVSSTEEQVPFVADTEFLDSPDSVNEVVVEKGDTLWEIASQFKDDDHSMQQVMLALQMMNPDAFLRDNINNLKVGSVLRVPDMDVMDKLSKQEAYAQVLDQNGLWDEYVARKSGTTNNNVVAEPADVIESTQQESESQLSLLTADESESDTASLQNEANSDESAGQIRKQLALAEEELEAARLENDELKTRIEMLEQQQSKFEELQKLVTIEDSGLAQLQQDSKEADEIEETVIEEAVVAEEQVAEIVEETISETTDVEITEEEKPTDVMIEAADEMLSEETELSETELSEEMLTEEVAEEMMEEGLSTEAETVIPTTEETDMVATEEEQSVEPETATVPAPAIITEPESSDGLMDMLPPMDELLNDPVMLGGIGAIIALLLGLVFFKSKKSDKDEEGITIDEPESLLDDDATPIHVPSTVQESTDDEDRSHETEISEPDLDAESGMTETIVSEIDEQIDEGDYSTTDVVSIVDDSEAESASVEQDDVLNEVDVYLAYGLYDNAESLLTESLENHPDRADYRAKLLDTHFATKNKDAFVKEAEVLKSLGAAADRFWDRIQIMGFELAPENDLFSGAKESNVSVEDLEYAKPESADFDIGADEDVTDFSNTDFDLGSDSFVVSATEAMDLPDDELARTQDIESLDIDFPELGEDEQSESAEFELPDDISAEVDESLNIDEELATDSEDDLNFDLPEDLDLSVDSEMEELEPTVEAPASLDEVPPLGDEEDSLEVDSETDSEQESVTADDELTSETLVVPPGADLTAEVDVPDTIGSLDEEKDDLDADILADDDLDFDMSDMDGTDFQSGDFEPSETVALSTLDAKEDDITEFKPANATGEFDAFISEATNEDAIAEVDATAGLDRTGTYAPGDFNEEEVDELTDIDDIGDIEDLMLPDDVDEVSTKLDLAKAFIDMGDAEGAKGSLEEVLLEGTTEQKAEATGLLESIK